MKQKNPKEKLVFLFGNGDDDGWGDGGRRFEVRLSSNEANPVAAFSGGWKHQVPSGRRIFQAYFGQEETCCGFPTMSSFWEHRDSGKYVKEMGEALAAYLTENAEYMSAYIPDRKSYAISRKVLENAGFKVGLSLNSKHSGQAGRKTYTNSRWEWFANHLKKVKNEKAVATLTV